MVPTHERDDPAQIGREFWLRQAEQDGVVAVNPGARIASVHSWTRHMLQTWTLERLQAFAPRFRRCVDLGCGFGDWAELFATIADEVHGCELAPAFVEQARRRVPGAAIECGDIRDYQIPAGADLVYLGAVLMYLPERDALDVLQRIRAAVAPGAVLAWREWCTFNLGRRTVYQTAERFSIHRTPVELCWLAELAGFELVELRSAYSIYAQVIGKRALQWPLRGLVRVATLPLRRASHTLLLRATPAPAVRARLGSRPRAPG